MRFRTYGWVQNPSSFKNLKKVVQIFDNSSVHYRALKDVLVDQYIYFDDVKNNLLNKLNNGIEVFTYAELVGRNIGKDKKTPKSRSASVGDSLIQISIVPQQTQKTGKFWTDNWTSDGFLRWAVSLNFLETDRETDTFSITPLGKLFSQAIEGSEKELQLLRDALLSYPPATQILSILNDESVSRTKFYIGDKLGFRGEKGFTSYNEDIMFEWLETAANTEERKKIKSDVEGTSDKYARGICNWLINVGFVKRTTIKRTFTNGKRDGFPGYAITAKGKHAFSQAQGSSKNKSREKFIMWEFLATDGANREYIRTRRAYILKILQNTKSFNVLERELRAKGFYDDIEIIKNDIQGLNYFGIRIHVEGNTVELKDKINDFEIPYINLTTQLKNKQIENKKVQFLRDTKLPMKYIELLEIAYDGQRNRDFEIVTSDLFRNIYKLNSIHLGGSRKPDGIVFSNDFGIIIDTKAYEKGYSKDISQADEMIRYIEDNKRRDKLRNPNEWWTNFSTSIPADSYYYLWISSNFIGKFHEQLEYTTSQTNVSGGALNVEQLLIGASKVQDGTLNINDFPNYMTSKEITFS